MSDHQILNNVDHRDLRVLLRPGADLGDDVMCTLAIPSEFHTIQAEYPILFHRDPAAGLFLPMVLFGLEEGENLYLEGERWKARYQPLMIQRGPFTIGLQKSAAGAPGERQLVISIDVDSPRVGDAEGEPLFEPFGGQSGYVDRIASVLREIDEGQPVIRELSGLLEQHQLFEPLTLKAELRNGQQLTLTGFHALSEERLAQLDGDLLAAWSQRGLLQAMYMAVASMANLNRLLELKSERV
jgi:hypothetical protein